MTARWLGRLWQSVVCWSLAGVGPLPSGHIDADHNAGTASGVLLAWGAVEDIKAWRGGRSE
jgi:hypothetical protein